MLVTFRWVCPMKLQHLAATDKEPPMIRLFDFDSSEAGQLVGELRKLADGEVQQLTLHDLPFITRLNEIELTAMTDERPRNPDVDFAILGGSTTTSFIWRGSREEWRATCSMIEPLTEHCDAESYLWLTEDLGVMLLMSPSGSW